MAAHKVPLHYGWIVVFAGLLTVFACLGIGRFALGMLLPSMGVNLDLNYSQMGFISTGNFVGYLVAVLISGYLMRRLGARKLIFLALLIIGISMVWISRTNHFLAILALYIVTGFGSGAANIPIMGLISHWFAPHKRGKAAGYMVVGNGLAIMFAGEFLPRINAAQGLEGWRTGWAFLGVIVLVISLICLLLLRNNPQSMGLIPVGESDNQATTKLAKPVEFSDRRKYIFHMGCIYFLFGFTYVIYATFVVTTLVQEWQFSEAQAGRVWFWIGFLSLFSGPIFGGLSDKLGRKTGLIIVFSLQTLAYLLIASTSELLFLYLSVGLFGLVAWSIPSIFAAMVGDYMGPQLAATAFGYITFFFGIGQIVGPALAGILAEQGGGFSSSYLMAASMTAIAVVFTLLLKNPAITEDPAHD